MDNIVVLAAIILLFASPAYAYVDPGTGGMLLQLLTAGVAGLGVLIRLYWQKLRTRVRPQKRDSEGGEHETIATPPDE